MNLKRIKDAVDAVPMGYPICQVSGSILGLLPHWRSLDVDAKINTLESDGKCSPSHGKSTKRASQFDLKLTREKTKSNLRAYRLGFQKSLR